MYTYPAQKISLKGARDIKIVGVRGHLKILGNARAKFLSLKVQHSQGRKFEDWHLSVEKRGKTIFLEVFNVAYGKQWKKEIREELWPEFDIELAGPSLPTTVGWREGSIDIQRWDGDLEVSFLKGHAKIYGGHGKISITPVNASVSVREHSGPLEIQGQSGRVNLVRNHGETNLNWFGGTVFVDDCHGNVRLETSTADVTVRGGKGKLALQMGKGSARIMGFGGQVQGWGDQTKWELAASAPADLNITTVTGPVGVNWLTGGAKVFLTSNRGSIQFPQSGFLKVGDREGRRVVEGVKTSKSMGQVFIRTESGSIRWR